MKMTFEELEAREARFLHKTFDWHGHPCPMLGIKFDTWGDALVRLETGSVIELWVRTNWRTVPYELKPPLEERSRFEFRGAFSLDPWRQVDYCLPL